MRITIGADHAGFELKHALITFLREEGRQPTDADRRLAKSLAINNVMLAVKPPGRRNHESRFHC